MPFKTNFSATGLALGVAILTAQPALAETAVAKVDAARQNELLYFVKHDCGSCHGMTLKGGLGPALLPETLAAKPKEFLITTILQGRENTAMPPWNPMLSREDATWIVEQLQSGQITQTRLAKGAQ
jgi:cytochrome c55X